MARGVLIVCRSDNPANGGKAQRRNWTIYEAIKIISSCVAIHRAGGRSNSMGSILVIEDEKGILGLIEAALVRFGHRVETAEDGKEGIRKFDRGSFDMVITDYIMPGVNGHGVLQHIRSSARHRTPIIGMSGTPWLLHGTGFDLVLAKPFPLNKLVDSVRTLSTSALMVPEAACS